jgi:hypothetical protein
VLDAVNKVLGFTYAAIMEPQGRRIGYCQTPWVPTGTCGKAPAVCRRQGSDGRFFFGQRARIRPRRRKGAALCGWSSLGALGVSDPYLDWGKKVRGSQRRTRSSRGVQF